MISKLLTLIQRLHVPNSVSDYQLVQEKNWLLNKNQKSYQYCTELLEYSKNNY